MSEVMEILKAILTIENFIIDLMWPIAIGVFTIGLMIKIICEILDFAIMKKWRK